MLKKIPHKRKLRNFLKQVAIVVLIFFVTFIILVVSYEIPSLRSGRIASPLAIFGQKFQDRSIMEENSKKLQLALDKNTISYSNIAAAENNTTLVTFKDGQDVIFDNSKNFDQQITSLQLIMKQLTIEGKRFHRIDFRFDNPVVSF